MSKVPIDTLIDTLLDERPIHESIVDFIKDIASATEALKASVHIKKTVLPHNHDEIGKAWQECMEYLHLDDAQFGVLPALEAKKAAEQLKAKKKAAAEQKPDVQNADRIRC